MLHKLKSKISAGWLPLTAVFVMGLAVRFYYLGGAANGGQWFDPTSAEVRAWTALGFWDMLDWLRHWEFPPFHYVLLNGWVRVFGSSEWALQFPSAAFSGLTVVVVYKLGRELFNKEVGLTSALLLAFSPFAVGFAHHAKMYALFWFLGASSFLFFFRFLKEGGKVSYRFYILASVLSCYTLYTGFLLLAAQTVFFLLTAPRSRWQEWLTGQAVIIFLCAPWLLWFACSQHEVFKLRLPYTAFDYVQFSISAFQSIAGDSNGYFRRINPLLYVFLLVYLLTDTAAALLRKKTDPALFKNHLGLWTWVLVPVLVYFAVDYFFIRARLVDRYIGFIQVPLLLLVSSQLNRFPGKVRTTAIGAMALLGMYNTHMYFSGYLRFLP